MSKLSTTERQILAIAIAVQANKPILALGAPGTGKSATMDALAYSLGREIYTVIASLREPSDFCGLPCVSIVNGRPTVVMAEPKWARDASESEVAGIIFLDEVTLAPPSVQHALLRVVNERWVGDYKLNPEVAFVLAGNTAEHASGAHDLTGPLANRLVHLKWEWNPLEWCEGMQSGFAGNRVNAAGEPGEPMPLPKLPKGWEKEFIPQMDSLVASFIHTFPQNGLQEPKDEAGWAAAFPSPRSWSNASHLMAACKAANMPSDVELLLIAGCVGAPMATQFRAWVQDMNMPDPETLLANPASFKVPERMDRTYTILSAVAAAVQARNTLPRWQAAWKVMESCANQGRIDVAAAAAKSLVIHKPKGAVAPREAAVFIPLFQKAGLLK